MHHPPDILTFDLAIAVMKSKVIAAMMTFQSLGKL